MKFDKSKVYTALDADALEPGDIVFANDSIANLKKLDSRYILTIRHIEDDTHSCRFCGPANTCWMFAYLIAKHNDPYKELKEAQAKGKPVWHKCDGKWVSNKDEDCEWSFNMPINNYSLTRPELFLKDFKLGDKVEYDEIQQIVMAIDTSSEANYSVMLSFSGWLKNSELNKLKKLED